MRTLLVVLALAATVLSGCATDPVDQALDDTEDTISELLAGPALWEDPQNTPHPAYGWATLSNPPAANTTLPWAWQPFNGTELPDHIAGISQVTSVGNVSAGAGIALFGSIAVVPDDAGTTYIVDISDPTAPVQLSSVDSAGRGAAIIAYPDGRLVAASATTPGFDVIEFTDPEHPQLLTAVETPNRGHKLGIVPGTPVLYNAASNGGGTTPLIAPSPCNVTPDQCVGTTEIYDLSDPANPVLVKDWANGLQCHHIFFWNSPDGAKQRGICAGIQYTQLWDTSDPLNPSVIVNIPVHHGVADSPSAQASVAMFSHSAGINVRGDILYVGDEMMGGGLPPGCLAGTADPVTGTEVGTPVGATWFYDISDETNPILMGYFAPPRDADHSPGRSCTTHHGRVIPDKEGRDLLAMSFYNDGMILIDFTPTAGVIAPKVVDEFADGSDTWETWYAGGYLFTGDLARGMDVFSFE